jgi:hypothetical protein
VGARGLETSALFAVVLVYCVNTSVHDHLFTLLSLSVSSLNSSGDVDIRVPLSKGLAGWVATKGRILSIEDAYDDDRFSQVCSSLLVDLVVVAVQYCFPLSHFLYLSLSFTGG